MNQTTSVILENRNFELSIIDNQIYVVEVNDVDEFKISDLEVLVSMQKKMGARQLPVLVICNEYASTNVELLDVLAKNINNPYSKADAFVIKSLAQKILANFYFRFKRPERPTHFFNDIDEAKKWLTQFV